MSPTVSKIICQQTVINLFLQGHLPPHFITLSHISSFITASLFFMLLPCWFWAIQRNIGKDFIYLLCFSTIITWLIKDSTHLLRPFLLCHTPNLRPASGFSFPSGDVLVAVVVFGGLAHVYHHRIGYLVATCLTSLVAYSRLALGVHFFSDVIGGVIIGLVILQIYFHYWPRFATWFNTHVTPQVFACIMLPLFISWFSAEQTPKLGAGILAGFWLSSHYCQARLTDKKPSLLLSFVSSWLLLLLFYGLPLMSKYIPPTYLSYSIGFMMGNWMGSFPYLSTKSNAAHP